MREYSRFSGEVKSLLEKYTPIIQQASIDEFYLDFSGTKRIYGSIFDIAKKIQNEIQNELNLPCSIGIGTNKTIAKICSDYAKPKGVTYIFPGMEKAFLSPLPVQVIPGVGKVMLESLNSKGFITIEDITKISEEYFSLTYGKAGISLWNKANGKGSTNINLDKERLSISKERTYEKDEVNFDEIENTLFNLTGKVCQSLRDKNWETATISIKLRYSDFVTLTRSKTIKATNDDKIIFETALKLLKNAHTRRIAVRLIGIHLTNFSEFCEQESLFDEEIKNRNGMLEAVTSIRDKYGFNLIKFGNIGVQK
jgi:DNA polymerase-4